MLSLEVQAYNKWIERNKLYMSTIAQVVDENKISALVA